MVQSQTLPIEIRCETLVPVNDNNVGAGRCPVCNAPGSIAPRASEYRGKGVIHHRWLCRTCGHEWITVLHVSV
jgi:transposase-like protein